MPFTFYPLCDQGGQQKVVYVCTFELGNVEGSTSVIIIFVLCRQTPLLVCNPTFSHHSDGPDYIGTEKNLTFPAGTNAINFTVVIVDDDVNECSKDFFLHLEIPLAAAAMGVVKGSHHNGTVTITDEQSGKWCSNAAMQQCITSQFYAKHTMHKYTVTLFKAWCTFIAACTACTLIPLW